MDVIGQMELVKSTLVVSGPPAPPQAFKFLWRREEANDEEEAVQAFLRCSTSP